MHQSKLLSSPDPNHIVLASNSSHRYTLRMFDLTTEELRILRKLNTPQKIQNFLDLIPINYEPQGDTCSSPHIILRERRAHCIEAAMLAALAFRVHGRKPLILDLTSAPHDFDHVIALFQQDGHWGAISKSNHTVLRYRDPVYRTLRELVMSYFNEYTDEQGKKTLRSYSRPVDLSRFDADDWMTSEKNVWSVPLYLCHIQHIPLLNRKQVAGLRKADAFECRSGEILEWPKKI